MFQLMHDGGQIVAGLGDGEGFDHGGLLDGYHYGYFATGGSHDQEQPESRSRNKQPMFFRENDMTP